ncbi:hypothetical protein [Pararhizobium sp. DWP3-4]|uniref:hypothetical protein n=1 Tax=Pararhizobium sp. DWP3-4 TaxID=2804565 RepID=UPI003CE97CE7
METRNDVFEAPPIDRQGSGPGGRFRDYLRAVRGAAVPRQLSHSSDRRLPAWEITNLVQAFAGYLPLVFAVGGFLSVFMTNVPIFSVLWLRALGDGWGTAKTLRNR